MEKQCKIFTCKICGFSYEGKNSTRLRLHLQKNHSISLEDYCRKYEPEKGGYCKFCGKPTSFLNYSDGFNTYCSPKCAKMSPDVKEKTKKTNLEKYGVENPFQNEGIKKRIKEVIQDKYGVDNVSQSEAIKQKKEETTFSHYGVKYALSLPENKKKADEVFLKKYGVKRPAQVAEFKKKIFKTNIERYGAKSIPESPLFENPFNRKETQEKIRQKFKQKYGVENYTQTLEYRKQHRKQFYDRFLEILQEKHLELITSYDDFLISDVITLKCLLDGTVFTTSTLGKKTLTCPTCKEKRYESRCERNLYLWLKDTLPEYTIQRHNRKILQHNREIDILINGDYGVEVDGVYWHSEKFSEKLDSVNKSISADSNDIMLIHIFDVELEQHRKAVESFILRHFGKCNVIPYQNLTIERITDNEYNEFIATNGLLHNIEVDHCYAVKNDTETIATFSEHNGLVHSITFKNLTTCDIIAVLQKYDQFKMIQFEKRLNFKCVDSRLKYLYDTPPRPFYYSPKTKKFFENYNKPNEEALQVFDCGSVIYEISNSR